MSKRTKLTRTRAEAVDNFVEALRNESPTISSVIELDKFVGDYKSGAPLIQGNYAKPLSHSNPQLVKKKKASWWKVLLGMHD